jgi:hypothetical protein
MNLNNVNKRNTREWTLFNSNSKARQNRQTLIEKHGGSWEFKGNTWFWDQKTNHLIKFKNTPKSQKRTRSLYIFTDKEGIKYITDNFEGFCRERKINSSAMYDVISGKRKTFKGFTVERIKPEDKG